jgi:PAS domain S-box-containing protein
MVSGNHALVRATTEDELFQNMCRVIVETGGYRMAWIGQVEHDEEKSIRPLAHAGHEEGYLTLAKLSWADNPQGRGPSGLSVRTGVTQFSNDITVHPIMGLWKELALERRYLSSISLPLREKAGVFGALTIYADEPNAFGPEEVALLEELADDVSYGVTALRMRRDHDRIEQTLRLIEERRLAEETFRQSEERFRVALSNSPIAVFEQDLDLRYTWIFNPKLGYQANEVIGKFDDELMESGSAARVTEIKRRVIETGEPTREEVTTAAPDGPLETYDLSVEPLRDDLGHILGVICAATDITERKRIEQVLRESETRKSFLLELTDTLKPMSDPDGTRKPPARLWGGKLVAIRCCMPKSTRPKQSRSFRRTGPTVRWRAMWGCTNSWTSVRSSLTI